MSIHYYLPRLFVRFRQLGVIPLNQLDSNKLDIYKSMLRPLLFSGLKVDPEIAHQQMLRLLSWLATPNQDSRSIGGHPLKASLNQWLQQSCTLQPTTLSQPLSQTVWGLTFTNPIGLAAGFDKDGLAANGWHRFGFGFAELGTVTFHAQPGNPKPRLFRLPIDQAALNRMGFNNLGAAALAAQLERGSVADRPIPLGVNLGKSKITPLESAAEDYLNSFRLLKAWGDYFVVNVSSPNTPGLRSLQATDQLDLILTALQQENQAEKPMLVKIAPDLEWEAIADVITLAQTHRLSGIIATNTTIRRDRLKTERLAATGNLVSEEAGGISGAPLRQRSTGGDSVYLRENQGHTADRRSRGDLYCR